MIINIVRKSTTPETPAPFTADGRPSWVGIFSKSQAAEFLAVVAKPGKKFVADIEAVHVDGVQVYPVA